MSTSPVARVVDYEPPAHAERSAPVPTRRSAPARPRRLQAVPPISARRQAASGFADAALRTVLEVIDQRRPAGQLGPLLVGGLADAVLALRRAGADRSCPAAVLRRVRVQATDAAETAFEVAAVYTRGPRTHALAGRIQLTQTARGLRWQFAALHIG
ncbi:hypothetical protein MMUR_50960 [Mycolicibacterium murale]|jgi:hypothetical protein|uniref:Alanine, arginine and proline rich protein n=1 Tax=Mycolicibacterium murale TaxID=182220 RepID=A0A7I9WUC5_9MYCO|nr:Rv3235 family protein [Mycolicibacterium murale]ANW63808.1 hypothetical protein BCA37_09510 [Mycobacterium sp. djl-10]MCV7181588.1 hypothetical protein [Mycolicibacterium murale]GFG60960.1 hypothetical protein MMUR_50960 [Mycolicibacterium murale]